MANSSLQGKTYTIPEPVISILQSINSNNFSKRRNSLITDRQITYEQLKYFKHDIEQSRDVEWSPFLKWINKVLTHDRDSVNRSKVNTNNSGMSNRYRSERNSIEPTNYHDALVNEEFSRTLKKELIKYRNYGK